MNLFNKEDLEKAIFKWKDLHGKTLKIFVGEQNDAICVVGFDVQSGHNYVLYTRFSEGVK